MATSGSVYADVMEILACAVGTSSSLVQRPRVKKMVPPSEQTTHMHIPSMGTEGVDADVNMAHPLTKQKKESAFCFLKVGRGVHEVDGSADGDVREGEGSAERSVREGSFRCKQRGKYSKIIFPEDDASLVAEQSPTPPVADDKTEEVVVRLRGKVIEMEKALSRARDSINCTQRVHNKLEYERRLHKSYFDNTYKELFEFQCRYGKIKIWRDEVLLKEGDRFALLQKSLKDKRFADESDKLECQRSLLSLMLYFEAEVNSEQGLKEAYLELLTERGIVPDPARVKLLV
ncbi:hypothetical protein GIB67_028741 [Kingdonia uniflora]|uniref:Uncharacterized protein n=1 Tax=Kingdonia uniflora TaxID=39325 RepID=A0A7J7NA64_9MAGN|nr:hypothetical protein GIB67_028741 [Kingdonia uniflora]